MSSNLFGWSYPAGCSGPPDEYEGPCEVCGNAVDDCICPECPTCGEQGNPDCYYVGDEPCQHGLILNEQQIAGRTDAEKREREAADACAAEAAYWSSPDRAKEEW